MPAGHRDEVGEEVDRDTPRIGRHVETRPDRERRELLLDLRDMPVAADPIRRDALVDLAEQEARLRLTPGARDAALGIDHEVPDQPARASGASARRVAVG